jgi:hypothetical protein
MPTIDVDVTELAKQLHVPRFAVDDMDCVNVRAWQIRMLCSAVIGQDTLIAAGIEAERARCLGIANRHAQMAGSMGASEKARTAASIAADIGA